MRKLCILLFVVGLSTQMFGQDPEVQKLSEVYIPARNFKYLNKVDSKVAAIPVKLLQRKVASYDIKTADFYYDEHDFYTVSFFIPEGKIVAEYDGNGNIIQTIEKFKNISLPLEVSQAVAKRFPNWSISRDVYLLNYHNDKGVKETYKLTLENGDERLKVKTDADGNFL